MASLAGKMGVNNAARITPGMLEDQVAKGETDAYKWRQTADEVEITFKRQGLQKSDVKLVKVTFSRLRLKVEHKGEALIDEALSGATHADECTWTLSDGELQVTLAKEKEETWPELIKPAS